MIQAVKCYKSSDGMNHDSLLQALLAEKRIEIRGAFVRAGEEVGIKINGTVPSEDVIKILSRSTKEISKIVNRFDKMISKERGKVIKAATN